MDELEAIRAYQSGRADAFAVLFELHAAHVYRTSYLITRDVGRAEDHAIARCDIHEIEVDPRASDSPGEAHPTCRASG